jgi:hypothetical protein
MKKYTKFIRLIGIFSLILSCQNSSEPKWDLNFQKMEIHYTKVGGWIHPTKLDIYGNGLVNTYLFNHSSYTATDSASTSLNRKQQKELAILFQSFASYDKYYEPKPGDWVTDQNTHTIILIYDSVPDTVSVYMPDKSDIPLSLIKIIMEMELLWANVINGN